MLLDLMLLFDPFILNKLDNGEVFNLVPFMTTISKWLDNWWTSAMIVWLFETNENI